MDISNADLAKILRSIAASYTIKGGNIFQIRAYESAADTIEHSTTDIGDLWKDGKLDQIPGIGPGIRSHLDELFKTGKVKHFEEIRKGIPDIVFELLSIPGIGPKTAQKIAELGVKSVNDLEKELKNGQLVKKGFSEKIAQNLLAGIHEFSQRDNRMLISHALDLAEVILKHLKASPEVLQVLPLGSLRRMAATIGDLDFAVSSNEPKAVINYFIKMPQVKRVLDQGESKATIILKNGIQVDLMVGKPESFGALTQHLTGSKNHNVHLRTLAQKKGLSLSELTPAKTEEEFYQLLGIQNPPPEIRENTGEIEAAIKNNLPGLVEITDIKGDLHTHSNFPLEPSHDPGENNIEEVIKKAEKLGYEFIGISDHPPAFTTHSQRQIIDLIAKRTKVVQQLKQSTNSIHVLNGLEVDILGDGSLSVPDETLTILDYCIAGIHSGQRSNITQRLLKALSNPHVDIISHPTNRLLGKRESSEGDWDRIFECCIKFKKILEINGHPMRLDLRDDLVRRAIKLGVKLIIKHAMDHFSTITSFPDVSEEVLMMT